MSSEGEGGIGIVIRVSGAAALILIAATLGLALTPVASPASETMAVQPDGKIVVAGSVYHPGGSRRGALVRFMPDGSLDRTFGIEGGLVDYRVRAERGADRPKPLGWRRTRSFDGAVAVQPDGKIVAAFGSEAGMYLLRYKADEAPDLGFGANGMAFLPGWRGEGQGFVQPIAISIRANGAIAVVYSSGYYGNRYGWKGSDTRIAEYAPDTSGGNLRSSNLDRAAFAEGVLRNADGSLLIAGGGSSAPDIPERTESLRLLAADYVTQPALAWTPDPSFGAAGDGVVAPNFFPAAAPPGFAVATVRSAGGLLAVGEAADSLGAAERPLIARFDSAGFLDAGFGEGGFVRPPATGPGLIEPEDAVGAGDGGMIVAGSVPVSGGWGMAVGRFDATGTADPGYGTGGLTQIETGGAPLQAVASSAAALADGDTLVSGRAPTSLNGAFYVVRLGSSGQQDPGFGSAGLASALPCQGMYRQLRKSGCRATARARLWVGGRPGRPTLTLRVAASEQTDALRAARLILPGKLRTGDRSRLKVVPVGGALVGSTKVRRGSVRVTRLGGLRAVKLRMRPGFLVVRRHRRGNFRAVFRLRVKFEDGSQQTVTLRRKVRGWRPAR